MLGIKLGPKETEDKKNSFWKNFQMTTNRKKKRRWKRRLYKSKDGFVSPRNFQSCGQFQVNVACDVLLMRRQEGRLGDPETAKTALDYVVAVSVNAREAAERGDAWKHVGLLVKQEKN